MATNVKPDQLRAAMSRGQNFIAQSDVYQNCLISELDAAKTQASTEGQPAGSHGGKPDAPEAGRQPEDQGKGRHRDQYRH